MSSSSGFAGRRFGAILALAAVTALAGCGFHLRGAATYPFATLYLNAPPGDPLTAELRRMIAGSAGTKLADKPGDAEAILDLTGIVDDKQVLSLSGGGRAREFMLSKRATIGVRDQAGRTWLPVSEVQVRRTYSFNEAEVLAREAQEARLLREIQSDVVQQIVRRLQAARRPAG